MVCSWTGPALDWMCCFLSSVMNAGGESLINQVGGPTWQGEEGHMGTEERLVGEMCKTRAG